MYSSKKLMEKKGENEFGNSVTFEGEKKSTSIQLRIFHTRDAPVRVSPPRAWVVSSDLDAFDMIFLFVVLLVSEHFMNSI